MCVVALWVRAHTLRFEHKCQGVNMSTIAPTKWTSDPEEKRKIASLAFFLGLLTGFLVGATGALFSVALMVAL